jgi:glucokinase
MDCLVSDFGGTRIKTGLLRNGRLEHSTMLPAITGEPIAATMNRVADALDSLCGQAGIDPRSCTGLAAALPALVDSSRNRVLNHYGKYPEAPGFDFDAWAQARWGIPAALENDARLALVGEWQHGAGQGSRRLAIVTLGTGIGSGVVLDGSLLRGPNFSSGNLCGHWIVRAGGRRCACGSRGCVEAETSGGSLYQRARERLQDLGREQELPPGFDYKALFELAARGVDWAVDLRATATSYWSILCANLFTTFDLDRVVLGGGIMHASDYLIPELVRETKQRASGCSERIDLRPARHPDHMALLGGEWLLREKLGI